MNDLIFPDKGKPNLKFTGGNYPGEGPVSPVGQELPTVSGEYIKADFVQKALYPGSGPVSPVGQAIPTLDGGYVKVKSLTRASFSGIRTVLLGSSITAGSSSYSNGTWENQGSLTELMVMNAGLHLVANMGIGGNDSTAMLARFDADVTPWRPDIVLLETLSNDLDQFNATFTNATVAPYLNNICALIEKCFAIEAVPVLITPPPSTTYQAAARRIQWYLFDIARYYGIRVIDPYSWLVNPTTGLYETGYSVDGIHPTPAGIAAGCLSGSEVLSNITSKQRPYLAAVSETVIGNPSNLLRNGAFYVSGSPPNPGGWTVNSTGAAQTLVAATKPYTGNTFTYDKTSGGAAYALDGNGDMSLVAGHLYEFSGRLKISGLNPGSASGCTLAINYASGAHRPFRSFVQNGDWQFLNQFTPQASGIWWANFYVADIGLYEINNLTLVDVTANRAIFNPGF